MWSTISPFLSIGIYGNCRNFPSPPDDGRGLLEIDVLNLSDSGYGDASPANVTHIATNLAVDGEIITSTP